MPSGILVLLRRFKYSIMSLVWRPTDTAAYKLYGVSRYSWMCRGRETGCTTWNIRNIADQPNCYSNILTRSEVYLYVWYLWNVPPQWRLENHARACTLGKSLKEDMTIGCLQHNIGVSFLDTCLNEPCLFTDNPIWPSCRYETKSLNNNKPHILDGNYDQSSRTTSFYNL